MTCLPSYEVEAAMTGAYGAVPRWTRLQSWVATQRAPVEPLPAAGGTSSTPCLRLRTVEAGAKLRGSRRDNIRFEWLLSERLPDNGHQARGSWGS